MAGGRALNGFGRADSLEQTFGGEHFALALSSPPHRTPFSLDPEVSVSVHARRRVHARRGAPPSRQALRGLSSRGAQRNARRWGGREDAPPRREDAEQGPQAPRISTPSNLAPTRDGGASQVEAGKQHGH